MTTTPTATPTLLEPEATSVATSPTMTPKKIIIRKSKPKDTTPNHETGYWTGTSGWNYDCWFSKNMRSVSTFYPANIKPNMALEYYSENFHIVEINCTFYKLPSAETVKEWFKSTPDNFRFIVKMSKYATHGKKLIDFEESFKNFWVDRIEHLRHKCLGILVQLPPIFTNSNNPSKVDGLTPLVRLQMAGKVTQSHNIRTFVEFRHASWFTPQVYEVLKEMSWSLVCVNVNNTSGGFGDFTTGFNPPLDKLPITLHNNIFFRNHGTGVVPYTGGYSENDLVDMVNWAKSNNIATAIFIFDNTDSLFGEVYRIGYQVMLNQTIIAMNGGLALPHAVYDAKLVSQLIS